MSMVKKYVIGGINNVIGADYNQTQLNPNYGLFEPNLGGNVGKYQINTAAINSSTDNQTDREQPTVRERNFNFADFTNNVNNYSKFNYSQFNPYYRPNPAFQTGLAFGVDASPAAKIGTTSDLVFQSLFNLSNKLQPFFQDSKLYKNQDQLRSEQTRGSQRVEQAQSGSGYKNGGNVPMYQNGTPYTDALDKNLAALAPNEIQLKPSETGIQAQLDYFSQANPPLPQTDFVPFQIQDPNLNTINTLPPVRQEPSRATAEENPNKAANIIGATAAVGSFGMDLAKGIAGGIGVGRRSAYAYDRAQEKMREATINQGFEKGREDLFNQGYLQTTGFLAQNGGQTPIVVSDLNDPRLQSYSDSLELWKQSLKIEPNPFKYPEITKEEYQKLVKKNKEVDDKSWGFDEVQYNQDKAKGKIKDFEHYMYEYPKYKDGELYSDYQKRLRTESPQYDKNYPVSDETPVIKKTLSNGVIREYETYKGEIYDDKTYVDFYPNGTIKRYWDGKLYNIDNPNISPSEQKYYGKNVVEEYDAYNITSKYKEGEKGEYKKTFDKTYKDYYVPYTSGSFYKKPTQPVIYKKPEPLTRTKQEPIKNVSVVDSKLNSTKLPDKVENVNTNIPNMFDNTYFANIYQPASGFTHIIRKKGSHEPVAYTKDGKYYPPDSDTRKRPEFQDGGEVPIITPEQEVKFQEWYSQYAGLTGGTPNPDDPTLNMDFRSKWLETGGKLPNGEVIFQSGGAIPVSMNGLKEYPKQEVIVPSNNITMKGINYDVLAFPNNDQPVLMKPDQNYQFPNSTQVLEKPMMKNGGMIKLEEGLYYNPTTQEFIQD